MLGRVILQKLGIISQLGEFVGLNLMQGIAQRHLSVVVMMPIALAVSSYVHKLRTFPGVAEATHQALSEALPVIQ